MGRLKHLILLAVFISSAILNGSTPARNNSEETDNEEIKTIKINKQLSKKKK